ESISFPVSTQTSVNRPAVRLSFIWLSERYFRGKRSDLDQKSGAVRTRASSPPRPPRPILRYAEATKLGFDRNLANGALVAELANTPPARPPPDIVARGRAVLDRPGESACLPSGAML